MSVGNVQNVQNVQSVRSTKYFLMCKPILSEQLAVLIGGIFYRDRRTLSARQSSTPLEKQLRMLQVAKYPNAIIATPHAAL